ncbi:MAG: Txe/YoeB family addiction module toxin [Holosporales bacterium]|jgi:Txe/YoeB family toxin of toxin-antitoxin system|nr:Txe/YoeB family addiction module toxin [Holosporales bacterium]
MWKVVFTKAAQKRSIKVAQYPALKRKVESLLALLEENPFADSPGYEKLVGDFQGCYSRRINVQHRLIYQVLADVKTVKVLVMWHTTTNLPAIPTTFFIIILVVNTIIISCFV